MFQAIIVHRTSTKSVYVSQSVTNLYYFVACLFNMKREFSSNINAYCG